MAIIGASSATVEHRQLIEAAGAAAVLIHVIRSAMRHDADVDSIFQGSDARLIIANTKSRS
jgi:hypothetical protein